MDGLKAEMLAGLQEVRSAAARESEARRQAGDDLMAARQKDRQRIIALEARLRELRGEIAKIGAELEAVSAAAPAMRAASPSAAHVSTSN